MTQIFTAKTVDEAKAEAVKAFGVPEAKITFEILEEPKKVLFVTTGEAKVQATYEPERSDIAADYIRNILKNMGISAELTVEPSEDGCVIDITGDTTGTVIGRRGETLDAIQYLASMVCNRSDKDYYRITVDCCGYREKRKAILEELAVKISKTVLRTGRTTVLEPMNPYERRIIHSAVAEIEGVTSHSTGEEPYRKVVISCTNPPKREPRQGGKPRYNDKRKGGYGKQRGERDIKPRSFDMAKTSFEKDYKKPKPEDSMGGDLYGKIDI